MARPQALIIGLGQFGMAVLRSLASSKMDVIAIDRNPEVVQLASALASEAACFDAMDEAALSRANPRDRDVCLCCIGESREGVILVTALLRQLGAPRVIARASDELLERILYLVGAHEVVNPERAYGQRLATRLLYQGITEAVPLGDDLMMSEIVAPGALLGRPLSDLALPRSYGITVVAIRRPDGAGKSRVVRPTPDVELVEADRVLVVAAPGAVEALMERLS
jgi:trk system potassium uptake protein TrkA